MNLYMQSCKTNRRTMPNTWLSELRHWYCHQQIAKTVIWQTQLYETCIKCKQLGKESIRSSSFACPTQQISLPYKIRHSETASALKTALKTHLFQSAYFVIFSTCLFRCSIPNRTPSGNVPRMTFPQLETSHEGVFRPPKGSPGDVLTAHNVPWGTFWGVPSNPKTSNTCPPPGNEPPTASPSA